MTGRNVEVVANMATYPLREESMLATVGRIAPQVDELRVILNQYTSIPTQLREWPNVVPIIPHEDTKDVGKFYRPNPPGSWVFLVDDDIVYPDHYVDFSLARMADLPSDRVIGGYHGTVYLRPRIEKLSLGGVRRWWAKYRRPIGDLRTTYKIDRELLEPIVVDQLGTGVMVLRAELVPSYEEMQGSQKFVDVRMARLSHAKKIAHVCLPHPASFMTGIEHEENIYHGFTKKFHAHVQKEIRLFARRNRRAGHVFASGSPDRKATG